jgi:hypothetical protein
MLRRALHRLRLRYRMRAPLAGLSNRHVAATLVTFLGR